MDLKAIQPELYTSRKILKVKPIWIKRISDIEGRAVSISHLLLKDQSTQVKRLLAEHSKNRYI